MGGAHLRLQQDGPPVVAQRRWAASRNGHEVFGPFQTRTPLIPARVQKAARGMASEVSPGSASRTRIQGQRSRSPRKEFPALGWARRCLSVRHARRCAASLVPRTTIFVGCHCDGNGGLHSVHGRGTVSRTSRRSSRPWVLTNRLWLCAAWVLTTRPWLCAAREALPQSAVVSHLRNGRPGRQQRRQLETKKGCHVNFMSTRLLPGCHAHSSPVHDTGLTAHGPTQPSPARPKPAQASPGQPTSPHLTAPHLSPAQRSPAQASPGQSRTSHLTPPHCTPPQPSPEQPSPAQPSPA